MTCAPDPLELLRRAVNRGAPADLAAFAETGAAGLEVLRRTLHAPAGALGAGSGRDAVDNLGAAVTAIAARWPDTFLAAFDPAEDRDSFVLMGLGEIDDARATARLVAASDTDDDTRRMTAAIGLGRRRPSPEASAALAALLHDVEYLVRYHALTGLARCGETSALPALRALTPKTPIERQLAEAAIAAIEARG